AACSLGLLALLGVGLASGILPIPPDQAADRYALDGTGAAFSLLLHTVGLGAVALLSGHLASRLERTGGQLERVTEGARRLAQRNADILHSIGSGVITTYLDGSLRSVNRAAAEALRA